MKPGVLLSDLDDQIWHTSGVFGPLVWFFHHPFSVVRLSQVEKMLMTNLITKIYGFWSTPKTGHVLLFLILLVFCTPKSNATGAIIDEPMTGPTAPDWIFGGSPNPAILTGNGVIDPVGVGWLRLTDTGNNQAGYAYLDTPFSITSGVVIQFDYTTWGGSGADGYSIFLFDAATAPFQIGASGGSLGYAQKTVAPMSPGLGGGYIGVGIDEYGNFANPTEGRVGGPGRLPNSVTVRGPASTNWAYLGGSAANVGQLWFNQGTRPAQTGTDYRKVVIYLTPVAAPNHLQVDVYLQFGYNQPLTPVVLGLFTGQPIPANVKIGYAASTGGSTNNHEIRNLLVNPLNNDINLAIFKSASVASMDVGDPITYTLTARNYGPNPSVTANDAPIIDNVPAEVTGVTWTCATTGTATCSAASGSGNNINTTATLPFNSSAIYTISGTLTSSPSSNQLLNTADLTVPAGLVDYNLRDNTDTASVLVNSDLSTSTKTVVDLNGGDIEIGDVLEYTITLNGTAGGTASSIRVTDDIPANVTGFSITSDVTGYTNNSTTTGGANGNGYLDISDITVQGGTSETVVFEVTVNGASGAAIDNTAVISNPGGPAASPSAPTLTIAGTSDLSTSTKTVVDLNGGDVETGDLLEYTITLNETKGGAASGIQVTDDIPANVTGFRITSDVTGYTNNSTTTGGANGNGYLDISNVTIAANGTETIVFEVTVNGAIAASIDNTATVINPDGPGATPNTQTLLITGPASGLKQLYLDGASQISRTPTVGIPGATTIAKESSFTWTQSPALQADVTIDPTVNATVPVNIYLDNNNRNVDVSVTLACSGGGSITSATQPFARSRSVNLASFNIPLGGPLTCTAGDTWMLTVNNATVNRRDRDILVYPVDPALPNGISQVILPSLNVINVDSVTSYNAAYPAVTTPASGNYTAGETVYVRAVVSDPFGSYDITSATFTIKDPNDVNMVTDTIRTEVADSGTSTKIYEYSYLVPAGATTGSWTTIVTANEGTEGTVSHSGTGAFSVAVNLPSILVNKAVETNWDPYNGFTDPFAIPGGIVKYTLTITNYGSGVPDNDTILITDPIPANTELVVTDPVVEVGNVPGDTGLTISYVSLTDAGDDIFFSTDGADFSYLPTADANGADVNVTDIRINPQGVFNPSDGATHPSFSVSFKVRIK